MSEQTHDFSEQVFFHCSFLVYFVPEDDYGHFSQLRHVQELIQLMLAFFQSLFVSCIDHVNDSINLAKVICPDLPSLRMSTQIIRVEPDISNSHFCLMRLLGRIGGCESVILKHVEHSCFASIVKTQEDYVGVLLEET